uniref:Uncharacterized protein n=1 Tax=Timema shepardi TaxID=629360 RepID=A0A7R9B8I6_TIMSH|nr:unnamed protein product [Timema shepardi]
MLLFREVKGSPTESFDSEPLFILRHAAIRRASCSMFPLVPVRPYVSPSEQNILDLKMAEEEAHRLAEMADNFRELALINMMNGVLEVRWEEEIKKDIPLPKCMVEKQPEEFDEDDLRVVREYEEKVKFLMSERERYKKLLDQERIKLTTARDVSISITRYQPICALNDLGGLYSVE